MEDTVTTENKELLDALLMGAEKAEEPGEMTKNPVVHKGDNEIPPMVGSVKSSAGYYFIYDRKTGDRSLCNRNMLPQILKAKNKDGSLIFTLQKPKIEPKKGTNKCMLHKDDPNRSKWDEMGLPVCPAAHLSSPYQVKRHMQKRHPAEWNAIEHDRMERERTEDRAAQKALYDAVGRKPEAPLYVSGKDKEAKKKNRRIP